MYSFARPIVGRVDEGIFLIFQSTGKLLIMILCNLMIMFAMDSNLMCFLRIIPLLAQSVEASFAGCSSQFYFVFVFCLEYTLRNVRYTVRIKKR